MRPDQPFESNEPLPNIEELLARLAPVENPAGALEIAPNIRELVAPLDLDKTVAILAGLMTDPKFQANCTRLDWAIRIVLALAAGKRRPKQANLARFLNSELSTAGVNRLEDPIEDFFVEPVLTRKGDFLIFSGFWEKASTHTEMVIEAFSGLPDSPPKAAALKSAYALLALSDALVQRVGVKRHAIGGGEPNGVISVPSETRLNALSSRVRFDPDEIKELGLELEDLDPFSSTARERGAILVGVPGDSPLELRPLLKGKHGLIIAAPANISTAVRALLIDVAVTHGLVRPLQRNLLEAQTGLLRQAAFGLIADGPVRLVDDHLYREAVRELSTGRYVHVIQSVDGFADWPRRAFGAITPCGPEWVGAIEKTIRDTSSVVRQRQNFIEGMTLWLPSGWGGGRSFSFQSDIDLSSWPLIALEPADAAVVSACEDGKPSDLWRLQKQVELVRQQGFGFFAANGFLNLFHWWRTTDHALVPPHLNDVQPPISINFDTNCLLEARREAAENLDRRMLLNPSGVWHFVAKLERSALTRTLGSVYGSLDAARRGTLVGISVHKNSTWWIELDQRVERPDRDLFEAWRTAMYWASRIMRPFLDGIRSKMVVPNILFTLIVDDLLNKGGSIADRPLSDQEIDDGIGLSVNPEERTARIELRVVWQRGFYRPDNYAEAALATTMLLGATRIFGMEPVPSDLKSLVMQSVGSTDFRHRHAFRTERAIDELVADGLIQGFAPIPVSAAALAKCGSAWHSHPRQSGVKIEGKETCLAFLHGFIEERRLALRGQVSRFDRKALVVAGLQGLQSAIAEERHWARSARALRAIHGIDEDFALSLESSNKANAVLRANSILVELAAAESVLENGQAVGRMDMEELQARAIQLFQAMDMLPAFYADRIEPSIHLSPTGDLLSVHDFEQTAIRPAAELRHARERAAASDAYVARFAPAPQDSASNAGLLDAIRDEYSAPKELFLAFPQALSLLCRSQGCGILTNRRSDLLRQLQGVDHLQGYDAGPLIGRLMLPSRNGWDHIPPGCRTGDFDLGKFDRRFSLIGRPIVVLSSDADPELVVAPGVVERAFVHNTGGAAIGGLQNEFWQSPRMRSYAGAAGAKEGMDFNVTVAESLSILGLRAWPSAKPSWCLNQKKTDQLDRLGDIDVLAVNADGNSVWVVEAKDLKLCRTLGEAARRLSEYRGRSNDGKPDALLRHLRRVEYLRRHAASLVQRLHLPSLPSVHGVLVVNAPQPMQQLHHEYSADSTVVMLDRIASVPWSKGWNSSLEGE